jgi:O-methyltransferase involved in polyketide biosynthesis
MYLEKTIISTLLTQIDYLSSNDSELIFTYMQEQQKENFQFANASRFVNWWLKLKGEHFTWGLKKERVESFMNEHHFSITKHLDYKKLKKRYLTTYDENEAIAEGENILVLTKN